MHIARTCCRGARLRVETDLARSTSELRLSAFPQSCEVKFHGRRTPNRSTYSTFQIGETQFVDNFIKGAIPVHGSKVILAVLQCLLIGGKGSQQQTVIKLAFLVCRLYIETSFVAHLKSCSGVSIRCKALQRLNFQLFSVTQGVD